MVQKGQAPPNNNVAINASPKGKFSRGCLYYNSLNSKQNKSFWGFSSEDLSAPSGSFFSFGYLTLITNFSSSSGNINNKKKYATRNEATDTYVLAKKVVAADKKSGNARIEDDRPLSVPSA